LPAPAPVGIVSVALIVAAPVVVKAVRVEVPLTANVPAIVVLPVPSATVNLSVSISKPPLRLAAPVNVVTPVTFTVEENVAAPPCAEVDDNVAAPVTPNVPPSVVAPVPTVNVLPAATVTLSFSAVVPFAVKVPVIVAAPPTFIVEDKTNDVPVAAPITGVTKVGVFANTNDPVPVLSLTAEFKFELVGDAKNDAIPVPKPLTPVAIGKPVALVKVALDGIPKFGVVKIGLVNVLLVNVSVPASVASVPVEPGSVMVLVPATAGATRFAVPDVEPLKFIPAKVGEEDVVTVCPMETMFEEIVTPVPALNVACLL
jgi:hypothetical protein